jgi:hypothetical protein
VPANDSWIYQGRDEKGRFGDGTSPQGGDQHAGSTTSDSGGNGLLSRAQAIAYGAVGHLSPAERLQYMAHLDRGGLSRLTENLLAWSHAANLDRNAFREKYLGGVGSDEVVDHLRDAADGAAKATTPEQLRDAAGEVAAAYRLVGAYRWARFIAHAHDRTVAATTPSTDVSNAQPIATKVQELLLTPRFPFLTEPPKGIVPRLMERIPRQSGKEAASDVPSWARGIPRRVGETPNDYAKRLMDDHHGPGNWKPTNREFNQIKKNGERAFRDPRETVPGADGSRPEASVSRQPASIKEQT